jgi:hypothetical protein
MGYFVAKQLAIVTALAGSGSEVKGEVRAVVNFVAIVLLRSRCPLQPESSSADETPKPDFGGMP